MPSLAAVRNRVTTVPRQAGPPAPPATPGPSARSGPHGRHRLAPRAVLAAGAAAWALSFAAWALLTYRHPGWLWHQQDLETYHDAAASLRHGQGRIYTEQFGAWPGPFIYPPFAALLFQRMLPLGLVGMKFVMAAASHLALIAAAWSAWGLTGRRMPTATRLGASLAVAAVALCTEPAHKTLVFGQVSLILLAAVLFDCALPDDNRFKGVAVGLATGFKLTPGLFVVYFLLTRRHRAAAVASGTFAATVLLGWLLLPQAAEQYWFHAINVTGSINTHVSLADVANQSLRAMIMRLLGDVPAATAVWVLCAAVTVVLGTAAAVAAHRRGLVLPGILITAAVALLVSPISWTHHWVWSVPMGVYLVDRAMRVRTRGSWVCVAAYTGSVGMVPWRMGEHGRWDARQPLLPFHPSWLAPHQDGLDFRWNAWQTMLGNSMLLVHLVVFTVVVACLLRRGGRTQEPTTASTVTAPAAPEVRHASPAHRCGR